jgi:hypothetical protein
MRTLCVLVVLWLGSLRVAHACDCAIAPTHQTLLDRSAAIFVGRVLSVAPPAAPSDLTITAQVEVLAAWRGIDAGAVITVTTEASDCGFHLVAGATNAFFTNKLREARQCMFDTDVRVATAKELAFLGPPASEVSDAQLARCTCVTSPVAGKLDPTLPELTAGAPVADGRYAISIPIKIKRRPKQLAKDVPLPTSISSPAGGCALKPPTKSFTFARAVFGETAFLTGCMADQLRVR